MLTPGSRGALRNSKASVSAASSPSGKPSFSAKRPAPIHPVSPQGQGLVGAALKIGFIHAKPGAAPAPTRAEAGSPGAKGQLLHPWLSMARQQQHRPQLQLSEGAGTPSQTSPFFIFWGLSWGAGLWGESSPAAKPSACRRAPGLGSNLSQRAQGVGGEQEELQAEYQWKGVFFKEPLEDRVCVFFFFKGKRESPYSLQQLQSSVILCRSQERLT